jgi:single-stranded-DNA-specific exonuclease
MSRINKHWQIAPKLPQEVIAELNGFPTPFQQILYNRGHSSRSSASQYLNAELPAGTDPFNMVGIQEAVERLEKALSDGEPIAIYGDYDADGVTATALLVQAIEKLGGKVQGYIPNRFDEGYGLNNEALATLKDSGVKLVVTVDCGIRSMEEASFARNNNLDLIITDHHHPIEEIPDALAVVNPKQCGDEYPDKDLAGVGLAYKLIQALIIHLNKNEHFVPDKFSESEFVDLVALGTVADLAPLVGENRYLVRQGLGLLQSTKRQGIHALIRISGINPRQISAGDIGFILGPRLNAAGRLDSALAALELLTTSDVNRAGQLAQQLDNQNRERQRIMREIQVLAEEMSLSNNPDGLLLFAAHPDFNPGVVGLAASRLTEQYYRPAIVAHLGETTTRGSCRSIPEFHITEALDSCKDLLEHHGGHAAASGFTVRNENLLQLIDKLTLIADESLSSKDLRPVLQADVELALSDLTPGLLDYLDKLQPTGYGNSQAIFVSRGLMVKNLRSVGKDGEHLKLVVSDGRITYDAIAFKQGFWLEEMPSVIDLMYSFEMNEFNGRETLQLRVKDLKPSGVED